MPRSSQHNREKQVCNVILTKLQKLCSLIILVIAIVISYWPTLVGRLVLLDGFTSKNDLLFFLILPSVQSIIMLMWPILAAKISPKLSAFDTPWVEKSDSEFISFILFLLIVLGTRSIIIFLTKQMGLHFTAQIEFSSNIAANIIFLIAVTLMVTLIIPIAEEIFWRGYAQARLEIVFGPEIALYAQAVAYAGLHFRPIGGSFTVFAYGLIFGL